MAVVVLYIFLSFVLALLVFKVLSVLSLINGRERFRRELFSIFFPRFLLARLITRRSFSAGLLWRRARGTSEKRGREENGDKNERQRKRRGKNNGGILGEKA